MYIMRAAIMYSNGVVVEGRDYGHIMTLARKLGFSLPDQIEGFVSSDGNFVLPNEAAEIAHEAGQLKEPVDILSPEHLWHQAVVE